jgi:glycosyltransferase involved in cell wall biosynthesis
MPAHWSPTFLAEAVESVLAQTHRELRLLVIDDSQGEAIAAVMERFGAESRVEYRRTEPMTAVQVMTELMRAGEGEYFAFLHDDDRWEPEVLERRVAFLERHGDCAMVFSGHVDIDERGQVISRFPAPFAEGIVPVSELLPEMQRRSVIDTMHSVLVRRNVLDAVGCHLDETFPRLYDWELWLRIAVRYPVGCIEEQDVSYRAHEEQMSARPGRAADFAAMAEHADRVVREHHPQLRLSERERKRRRAGVELSVALDALRADDSAAARRATRRALAVSPSVAASSRFAAVAAGIVGGRGGRRAVDWLRGARYRRSHERRSRGL